VKLCGDESEQIVRYGRQACIEELGILWSYYRGASFICSDGRRERLLTGKQNKKTEKQTGNM